MKLQKIIFGYLVLFLSFQIGIAQEKAKAELFEEFGNVTSEEFRARLDYLLLKMAQKPDSTAFIVIHNGKVSNNRERFRYEQNAKAFLHAKERFIGEKRIFIIRAEDKKEVQIQIWIIPEGAEKPSFNEVKWDVSIEPNAEPFIFTTTDSSERVLDGPPEYLSLNLFAEYLEGNAAARGHFVIKERSKENYRREQAKITDLLVNKYKINAKRLRFFYVRKNNLPVNYSPSSDYYPDVEVWLVP